jgi:putative membrane protein
MADRSAVLGVLATLAIGSGLGLVAFGMAGEWRAYWRLRMVETIRATLSRSDTPIEDFKAAALSWLKLVAANIPDSAAIEQTVRDAATPGRINAVLRERVVAPLQGSAQGIGSRAALEAGTLIALSPHASWDGVIAASRALMVIHQVARLYGLRPGPAVTVILIRKVAWTAAGTVGVDLLSQTLADHALGSLPVARHIASALPGTSLAAMRLYRLARVASEACCPVSA